MVKLIESSDRKLSRSSESPMKLSGEFALFDTKNQNGRIYPKDIYEKAITELIPKVKSRQCLGECDHPLDYDEVRLSNVSHLITDLHVEGNRVIGEVELLNTPAGKVVQALLEAGVPIGISSRAVGDVEESNGSEIVKNMSLITYDLVADPSFKTAVLDEVSSTKLGESLRLIESRLPCCNNDKDSTVRTFISEVRKSLIPCKDSSERDVSVSNIEIEALRRVSSGQQDQIRRLSEGRKIMSSEIKRLSTSLKEMRSKSKDYSVRINSLMSSMHKLQDSYNALVETTVSKKDYRAAKDEIVELRKRLVVESRGLSYSQVRDLLEGTTTEKEMYTKLDALRTRSNPTVLRDLRENSDSVSDEYRNRSKNSRLSNLISRI